MGQGARAGDSEDDEDIAADSGTDSEAEDAAVQDDEDAGADNAYAQLAAAMAEDSDAEDVPPSAADPTAVGGAGGAYAVVFEIKQT